MEFKFNDAKSARPGHLERCLCYDKFLKGYRCYVYDDISKYWCTQATTEHDPDGENHIVDYADFQVTEWASLSNVNKPSLSSDLDEAAEEYGRKEYSHAIHFWDEGLSKNKPEVMKEDFVNSFKAGAVWMAVQGWHDVTETPSIFGFYLVIHEKGWCVANYMGKGVVCESGWVEAIHHIEIEHPQKWLDLRDLIPKKQ